MLHQSYKLFHRICLNNLLRFLLIGNLIHQVPPFICINWADEVSPLVRGSKVLEDTKYLMRSVKRAVGAVGIWTEDNWDVKRVNSVYAMVSGRFNYERNNRFDPLIWSLVVKYLYEKRGCIIGE